MLVLIDESGDLGFKFERGSTRFFTIALVMFEDGEAALACEQAIENLKGRLGMPPRYEFHFHDDGHDRRLTFLSTIARYDFSCYTFTLDKTSPHLSMAGPDQGRPDYKWVCRVALGDAAAELDNATIVIDGSAERGFRQEIAIYLRREMNSKQRHQVRRVKIGRSSSDPLLQLVDYVAGVTNRLYEAKGGAEIYETHLRRKRRSQRKWP